jgi:hypothetical protein
MLEQKIAYGRYLLNPLPTTWLRKKLFKIFHIGDQLSNF